MLRVFDTSNNTWCDGEFCISAMGDLMKIKKRPFGFEKIELLSDSRYVWHEDIGLCDSNGNLIFEGDICEMNLPMEPDNPDNHTYESSYYVVVYSYENAAYYLMDMENGACCRFNEEVLQYITVVANVFDVDSVEEIRAEFSIANDEGV